MAGVHFCICFTFSPSCQCQSTVLVSSATRSRIEVDDGDSVGQYQDRQEQLWDDLFSNSAEWWDNRPGKKSLRYPDFTHKKTRQPLWVDNQKKPAWVNSRLHALDTQQLSSPQNLQRSQGHELRRLCENGQLDRALEVLYNMDNEGIVASRDLYSCLLKACAKKKALAHAKQVHAHLVRHKSQPSRYIGEHVVGTLVKCGGLDEALQAFHKLPERTVLSWTAVISGYALTGQGREALRMYRSMQREGVQPSTYTFVSLLKACSSIPDLEEGKLIHADVLRCRCESDLFVGTCLVDMYAKCGSIVDAQNVFNGLSQRDVVSWNALLAAYAQQGDAEKVLHLYGRMQVEGMSPDVRTYVSTLQACGMLGEKEEGLVADGRVTKVRSLEKGRAIHADSQKKHYDSDVFVGNSLISMYGKCGSMADAQRVFAGISQPDIVSWTAMITAYGQQGQAEKALQLFKHIRGEGMNLDVRTFVSALQACAMLAEKEEDVCVDGRLVKVKALETGIEIHAEAKKLGYESDIFVGSTLVSMYGKCGSVLDAQTVFDRLCQRNVVLWNVMISAYARQGQVEKALQLYEQMLVDGVSPNSRTIVNALQACCVWADSEEGGLDKELTTVNPLAKGKALHANAQSKGFYSDVFVGNTLITLYGKCGSTLDAQAVFDGLAHRDVVSWTMMLAGYAQQGQADTALLLYEQMQEEGVSADVWAFVSLLQGVGILAENEDDVLTNEQLVKAESLEKTRALHAEVWRKGHEGNVFVGTALIGLYGRCGSLVDAQNVFDSLLEHDVVSWNALLVVHVQQGQAQRALQLYEQMQEDCVSPNNRTFVSALQACCLLSGNENDTAEKPTKMKSLGKGKAIHAAAQRKGYDSDAYVGNVLVSMYAKCMSMKDAQNVFAGLCQRNVVSWTAMLAAYTQHGQAEKALKLYDEMQEEGVSQNARTFVSSLQACSMLAEMEEEVIVEGQLIKLKSFTKGRAIHDDVRSTGYAADIFVGNALVSMYGKCGSIADAQNVFNKELSQRDIVSWNAMLAVYAQHGQAEEALQLYDLMQKAGVNPNDRTFVSVLQACSTIAEQEADVIVNGRLVKRTSLEKGRAVHADIQKVGYGSDVFIGSSLVSLYGKCGSIVEAESVFNEISQRDVVAWTAMLSAYVEHGEGEKALQLYRQMEEECPTVDEITLVCLLKACSNTGSLPLCQKIHHRLLSIENAMSPLLVSTLIHTYGRCASMADAQAVFDALSKPDVVSWTALLAGYAREGNYTATLQGYDAMRLAGVTPDAVTFLSLMSACSHAGLVNKGVEYFESMNTEHGVTPEIEHYVSIADLLGRAGLFTRLEHLLSTMPMQPNLPMWLCVLGACRKHGNVLLGKRAFDSAVGLQPTHPAAYVLMSNIYIDAGMLDSEQEMNEMRLKAGACKEPGHSWIGHEEEVHTFMVGDHKHPEQEQIYSWLGTVDLELEGLQMSG